MGIGEKMALLAIIYTSRREHENKQLQNESEWKLHSTELVFLFKSTNFKKPPKPKPNSCIPFP
jgi:hypothetical protein